MPIPAATPAAARTFLCNPDNPVRQRRRRPVDWPARAAQREDGQQGRGRVGGQREAEGAAESAPPGAWLAWLIRPEQAGVWTGVMIPGHDTQSDAGWSPVAGRA